MELAQRYVYAVHQSGSFSKAAQKLFISQPSLSAMVKKHERELGFPIFDRSKNPLALTPEGAIYVEYLEDSIEKEGIMRSRVRAIGGARCKGLSVGGSSFLACRVFPRICASVIRKMPGINIKVDAGASTTSGTVKDKVEAGIIDIALAYTYDPRRFDAIPIFEERFYLVLRNDVAGAESLIPYSVGIEDVICGTVPENTVFNSDIRNASIKVPMIRRKNIPALDLQEYIDEFTVANCTIGNSRSGELWYDYMLEGLGADTASDVIIAANRYRSQDVIFVPINAPEGKRTSFIVYKKGTLLTEEAQTFISILKDMCSDRKAFLEGLVR